MEQLPFILKFIAGKYEGGEFELPGHGDIVIGRSQESNIVLIEDMVSRKHTRIIVEPSRVLVEDLKSTNGTYINGKRIEVSELHENDRLLIGTSLIRLTKKYSENSINSITPMHERDFSDEPKNIEMQGNLKDIPIADVIQLISNSKKTGVLKLVSEPHVMRMYLEQGKIVSVEWENHIGITPMKIICAILDCEIGNFYFSHQNIQMSSMFDIGTDLIILNGSKQNDEFKKIASSFASLNVVFALKTPLKKPLSDLSPIELELIQYVLNGFDLENILKKSKYTPYETISVIQKMLEEEYIEQF